MLFPFTLTVISISDIIYGHEQKNMGKHQRTYAAIFENPIRANIPWKDIEALLEYLGAEISEGSGSRVRVHLNGVRAIYHRPHPRKETDRGTVRKVRDFLEEAGIEKV
jgi:hypothetical protein